MVRPRLRPMICKRGKQLLCWGHVLRMANCHAMPSAPLFPAKEETRSTLEPLQHQISSAFLAAHGGQQHNRLSSNRTLYFGALFSQHATLCLPVATWAHV